jgi:hypothetical protein
MCDFSIGLEMSAIKDNAKLETTTKSFDCNVKTSLFSLVFHITFSFFF